MLKQFSSILNKIQNGEGLASEGVTAKTVPASSISAADDIISFAEKEKVDLIIGNRGLGGATTRFIMGSVASKVATHAPCNVYITKTAMS
jgi:nucleotide-binding universal stress UspA family protein